jgi:hypothetical protein
LVRCRKIVPMSFFALPPHGGTIVLSRSTRSGDRHTKWAGVASMHRLHSSLGHRIRTVGVTVAVVVRLAAEVSV